MTEEFLAYNGKIYQSENPDQTWMIFNRSTGRVIRLGRDSPPVGDFAEGDRKDYGGQRILPGLHDSHIHVSSVGKALLAIDLKGCSSIEEFQQRIKDYAEKNPTRTWLDGQQWEQDRMGRYPNREDIDAVLPDRPIMAMRICLHIAVLNSRALEIAENGLSPQSICMSSNLQKVWLTGRHWEQDQMGGRYPCKEDVDAVIADRPVILNRACGHVAVANSLALSMAGITKDTPNPEGGVIDRYPEGHPKAGEPTGILRESPAYAPIFKLIKNPDEEIEEWITIGMKYCLEHGLVAVHSNEPPYWSQFSKLARENKIPIRTFLAAYYSGRDCGSFPYPGESPGDMLSCDRIKIFADGALGSATARMSLPYKGGEDNYGVFIQPQETINKHVHEATARGFRLEIHVIGDAAADAAITAIEKADVAPERRPILTHCQILRDDLITRMKACGVVANIQPQFVPTDARWLGGLLNDGLMEYAYPWKTLLNRGIPCAGGSDAPVELAQPFLGIYDSIFRPSGDRDPDKIQVFKPSECLSVREAIDLYTKGGAYATIREHDLGQLKPGYFADFVVVSSETDVVENPKEFLKAKAAEVWVNGQLKFERSQ